MIVNLSVRNYALIESLDLEFKPNFTTITGETGSGKSILLGALGMILGQRADTAALKDKGVKCVIEGTFNLRDYSRNYSINDFFRRYDLDYDDLTSIRREITTSGRSRAFINDTPVNLNQLKELTTQLVDIHSQHETLELNQARFQRNVIDIYAGNDELLRKYVEHYQQHKELQQQLTDLEESEANARKDLDYLQFQFEELEKADLKPAETEGLEQELETLSNATDIKLGLRGLVELSSEMDGNIAEQFHTLKQNLSSIARWLPEGEDLVKRVDSLSIELNDLVGEFDSIEQGLETDPQRLEYVNERLDLLNNLLQKHRLNTTDELIQLRDEIAGKVGNIGSLSEQIEAAKQALVKSAATLSELAEKLSRKRQQAAPKLEKEIAGLLKQLALPQAELSVEIKALPEPGPTGTDAIDFLFKANKGGEFHAIGKVASGGELSRLMLAIKSILARVKTLPTVIFDEIDTGISGDVADKTGRILKEMAASIQVLAITHLPQMASKGDQHWRVFKDNSGKATVTHVLPLDADGRIDEIAKMLSGEALTDAARENARVLLENA